MHIAVIEEESTEKGYHERFNWQNLKCTRVAAGRPEQSGSCWIMQGEACKEHRREAAVTFPCSLLGLEQTLIYLNALHFGFLLQLKASESPGSREAGAGLDFMPIKIYFISIPTCGQRPCWFYLLLSSQSNLEQLPTPSRFFLASYLNDLLFR